MRLMILLVLAISFATATDARAQSCDVQFTASLGGCDNVYTAWTTKRLGAVSQTLTFDNLLTGAQKIIELAPGVRNYSLTGTGPGAHFNVLIVMHFGTGNCSATLHDLHNRPYDQCGAVAAPASVVSAANYRSYTAADSIAALFADGITTATLSATTLPLPKTLGGVTVSFDGQACEIFSVSPNQVNFHIPANVSTGLHSVRATNADGKSFNGDLYIQPQAPAVFTRSMTGDGPAAADYGNGYLSLYVDGVDPGTVTPADVWLQTSAGRYPASFIETQDGRPRQFIGVVQVNFVGVPINGQGAQLNVGAYQSQGFILQR